eukprot:gene18246-23297_t
MAVRPSEGETDGDARAGTLFRLDDQISAMEPGQAQGDGKPEPGAFMALVEGGIDLAEGPQRGFDLLGGHADPRILHADE